MDDAFILGVTPRCVKGIAKFKFFVVEDLPESISTVMS